MGAMQAQRAMELATKALARPRRKQSQQIVSGQQRRILLPFQEWSDVFGNGAKVDPGEPLPHQLPPEPRVVVASSLRLVQRVLQQRQIWDHRWTL
jgi:hypothetical protein